MALEDDHNNNLWEQAILRYIKTSGIKEMLLEEIKAMMAGADFNKAEQLLLDTMTPEQVMEYNNFRTQQLERLVDMNAANVDAQKQFFLSLIGAVLLAL